MTHLPYIVASYALGIGIPAVLGMLAWRRLALARRRLSAVDPRMGAGS
jgi:cytochrome c biogenesis protein CcdA